MARTTIILASLFFIAGLIVALLPAQDAVWRKSSVTAPRNFDPMEPGALPASLQEEAGPILPVAAEGEAPPQTADDIGPITEEQAQQQPDDSAYAPASEPSPIAPSGGLKSVLKRPLPRPRLEKSSEETPEESAVESSPAEPEETVTSAIPAEPPEQTPAAIPSIRPSTTRPLSPVTAREAQPVVPEQPAEVTPQVAAGPPSARRTTQSAKGGKLRTENVQEVNAESDYPAVHVQLTGPAAITVGKAGKYVVRVTNDGAAPAEEVQIRLPLPTWVKIGSAEATGGEAQMQAAGDGSPRLVWTIPAVKPQGHDELHLQLVAAEGQPFDLNVEWSCRAPAATARVSVRQPQLELALAGPSDMQFGEEKIFTLTVGNPGTGEASGVLVNIATGNNRPKEVEVGNILAGEQVEIPVQVVANQVGELQLRATASGDGSLKADAATKVLVRRAQLVITVEAPELKFAGSEAAYTVTVANSGDAPAEDVQISVAIPSGARYVGGVTGATSAKGSLAWKLGTLAAGAQKQFEIRCQLMVEGTNRVAVQAAGKAGLAANGSGATEVEAVSDLKLVVNDPSGPTPIGQEVAYEVQVMNRGSRSATNVKILVQFGEGVEPVELAGGQGKLIPGQVVCEPLPELAAGEQVTLRVKAKAEKTGSHRYRVEVTSGDEDARLVSEGTSRFFDSRGAAAARMAKKPADKKSADRETTVPGTIQR